MLNPTSMFDTAQTGDWDKAKHNILAATIENKH